jgi:hypothetical protein
MKDAQVHASLRALAIGSFLLASIILLPDVDKSRETPKSVKLEQQLDSFSANPL